LIYPQTSLSPNASNPRARAVESSDTAEDTTSTATSNLLHDRPDYRQAHKTPAQNQKLKHASVPDPTSSSPRLVFDTQSSADAKVLKVDLRVGASGYADLSSLERKSISSLIGSQIVKSLKHLDSLKDRVEDKSSKVLVTGDLNAGKSTFCNALMRRRVLPEDQQPCTSLFCEVLDVSLNNDVEEVHAVKHNVKYSPLDRDSYVVYSLDDLERLVDSADVYSSVKIYVSDNRKDSTLLHNGVVDIALIDAPGLNMDSLQTTAVFARQEQIDVVVFVVSAENHFTLSAKDFLWNAANEKAYLFIVVNRFDNIKDKERCRAQVLSQIAKLSPATYQDAADLVHFVSCQSIVDDPETPDLADFERLESSLRSFVLEKRARSKLVPVKTYLANVLDDVTILATANTDFADKEAKQAQEDLDQIQPDYEVRIKTKVRIGDQIERAIEGSCTDVLQTARKALNQFIQDMDSAPLVSYPGLLQFWKYAEDTRKAMCERLDAEVIKCEHLTRNQAISGVDMIRNVGLRHLPSSSPFNKTFHPEHMFRNKRHSIERKLNVEVGISDFFDFESQDLSAVVLSSATACTVLGSHFIPIKSWIDGALSFSQLLGSASARKWIVVPLTLSVTGGIIWYVVSDIPRAVPKRIAKKIRRELERVDYVNHNADRVTRELRTVLGVPEEYLRRQFQKDIDERAKAKEECTRTLQTAAAASTFFAQLKDDAVCLRTTVLGYELEPQIVESS
jgi:mitofusin 2